MNGREWKKWLFYFSLGTILIIIFKTIDSVSAIYNGFANLLNIIMPFVMAVLLAYMLFLPGKKIEAIFEKSKIKFLSNHKRALSVFIVYLIFLLVYGTLFETLLL